MDDNAIIKFNKPYTFEGQTYTEINLAGLDDLSTTQLQQAERIFERGGGVSAMKELNIEFACIVASIATGKPLEFFNNLPAREGNKIKTAVGSYFFGSD